MLLSTVLIHMMSEVRELLGRATRMGSIPKELEFPFAELLICIGNREGVPSILYTSIGGSVRGKN